MGETWLLIFFYLLRDYIHSRHLMVLCQKRGNAKSDVPRSGYGNLDVFQIFHVFIISISYFAIIRRLMDLKFAQAFQLEIQ